MVPRESPCGTFRGLLSGSFSRYSFEKIFAAQKDHTSAQTERKICLVASWFELMSLTRCLMAEKPNWRWLLAKWRMRVSTLAWSERNTAEPNQKPHSQSKVSGWKPSKRGKNPRFSCSSLAIVVSPINLSNENSNVSHSKCLTNFLRWSDDHFAFASRNSCRKHSAALAPYHVAFGG